MIATKVVSSAIPAIPNAVLENIIFRNLSLPELGICSRVCKAWREMAKKHLNAFSHPHAFGPKEWYTYFGGYLRDIPRVPFNVAEILNAPCPFWPDKKVYETHILVLVPQTVNGQPLSLKALGELVKKPLQGYATQYRYFDLGEHTDSSAPSSHWVLLTRDVIEESGNQSYEDQERLLTQKGKGVYTLPALLDATVCIFMTYVQSGIRLYDDSPYRWTRCQEKYNAKLHLGVGGFAPGGTSVTHYDTHGYEYDGVGGCRKFEIN
jgi:hypothetical protein